MNDNSSCYETSKDHVNHQGAEVSIRRAKDVQFRPGMNNEIQNMVSQCPVCNDYLTKQHQRFQPDHGTRPVYVRLRKLSNYCRLTSWKGGPERVRVPCVLRSLPRHWLGNHEVPGSMPGWGFLLLLFPWARNFTSRSCMEEWL